MPGPGNLSWFAIGGRFEVTELQPFLEKISIIGSYFPGPSSEE